MVKMANLGTFEGSPVTTSKVKVTSAGDGLSKAMTVEPVAYKKGDRVVIVLDCVVRRVEFEDGDINGDVCRVHVFKAGQAVVIDRQLVAEMLEEQAERIKQAEDDARGRLTLEGTVPQLPDKPTDAPASMAKARAAKKEGKAPRTPTKRGGVTP